MLLASRKMQAEVSEFIRQNPRPTKRESCFLYLKMNGLFGLIPKSVIEEDAEAKLEREAIMAESEK